MLLHGLYFSFSFVELGVVCSVEMDGLDGCTSRIHLCFCLGCNSRTSWGTFQLVGQVSFPKNVATFYRLLLYWLRLHCIRLHSGYCIYTYTVYTNITNINKNII